MAKRDRRPGIRGGSEFDAHGTGRFGATRSSTLERFQSQRRSAGGRRVSWVPELVECLRT